MPCRTEGRERRPGRQYQIIYANFTCEPRAHPHEPPGDSLSLILCLSHKAQGWGEVCGTVVAVCGGAGHAGAMFF